MSPTPADMAAAQRAITALTKAPQTMRDAFEDTYQAHIEDVLTLREHFTTIDGISPLEASILTLSTIMLTPEKDSE